MVRCRACCDTYCCKCHVQREGERSLYFFAIKVVTGLRRRFQYTRSSGSSALILLRSGSRDKPEANQSNLNFANALHLASRWVCRALRKKSHEMASVHSLARPSGLRRYPVGRRRSGQDAASEGMPPLDAHYKRMAEGTARGLEVSESTYEAVSNQEDAAYSILTLICPALT